MKTKWNAKKYTEDFSFVPKYGRELLDLVKAPQGSSVLDLGCGNGELTNVLADSGYRVLGLDQSEELLNIARERYPSLEFLHTDATDFKLTSPVDVVFSNAVFHWINRKQHGQMLRNIHRALKPGGELVFECGGSGNNQIIHETLDEIFSENGYEYKMPFYFPDITEYSNLLKRSGFETRFATLFDRPTLLKGENGLKEWIDMFIRDPFTVIGDQRKEEEIKEQAVEWMRDRLYTDGHWYADYVRLRMRAIRI